jgi:hypothetical protein
MVGGGEVLDVGEQGAEAFDWHSPNLVSRVTTVNAPKPAKLNRTNV